MDGQSREQVLGEKQALSFFYTAIYYCAKVIIINLELHLLSEIGEKKKQEIISHGNLSPLHNFTWGVGGG